VKLGTFFVDLFFKGLLYTNPPFNVIPEVCLRSPSLDALTSEAADIPSGSF
jgi:hypothetical protein